MATTEEPSISHKRKSVDDHIVSSTLPLSTRAGEYAVSTEASGAVGTTEYRLFFFNTTDNQRLTLSFNFPIHQIYFHRISPWHDVPLRNGDYFNCLIEIPKFTKAKMEIATKEKFNPIAQDIKKGKLREYHGPIFWNYGCLPQTWEDPTVFHPELEVYGDNDPVDVVEIGSKALPTGTICKIKILGAIAMIDDGELDWKMVGISVEDPLSSLLNDIADVDRNHPGTLSGIFIASK